MPILNSRAGSSPPSYSSSSSNSSGIDPSPTAITTSSPTFSFSKGAPTSDVVLVAFIAVGLFIATIGASYLIFKSLGVSEWYHSRQLLREHRLRKNTENEARTERTADIGEPGTPTPTTVSFLSPATPNAPEMRSNYDSITRKHFEYSRGASPISACLQPGVLVATRPAPPVPSLPASPPTAAQGHYPTSGNGKDGSDARKLAHKHISNTKLIFAHRFNLLRARGVPPGPSDGNDRDTNRNGEGGRRFGAGRIRTSISSPSSLISSVRSHTTKSPGSPIVPTSPRLESLWPNRVRGPRSPTPSLLQQAADTVVGAHPNPSDISVITPMPAVVQLLNSPELGKHYQFEFPWVARDMSFGMVAPDVSSAAARRNPSVNSKSRGGSGSGSSEEGMVYTVTNTPTQSPAAGGGSEHQRLSPRTPPKSQLSRGMFGDTTTTLHKTDTGAGITLSPPPPPFLMLNNGKYPGAGAGGAGGNLDQLEKESLDLSLSLSSKAIRKKPSRKFPPPAASSRLDGGGGAKENVDPNGSPKLLAMGAAAASQAREGRRLAESEPTTGIRQTSRSVFGISRV